MSGTEMVEIRVKTRLDTIKLKSRLRRTKLKLQRLTEIMNELTTINIVETRNKPNKTVQNSHKMRPSEYFIQMLGHLVKKIIMLASRC